MDGKNGTGSENEFNQGTSKLCHKKTHVFGSKNGLAVEDLVLFFTKTQNDSHVLFIENSTERRFSPSICFDLLGTLKV